MIKIPALKEFTLQWERQARRRGQKARRNSSEKRWWQGSLEHRGLLNLKNLGL